jgi:hypothetical protein
MAVYGKIKDRIAGLPREHSWQILVHMCCDRKLSFPKVAIELGMTKKALYNWINGVSTPSKDKEDLIDKFIQKLERLEK